MKYQYGKFYPDLSILVTLILEGWMVMLSLTQPPRNSRTENNLKIFISELSDFIKKPSSLEKLYTLQDLSASKWRYFQRETNSKHSFFPIWNISSNSLTTTENQLLHRRKYSWTILLPINDWSPNNIYHFRSVLLTSWYFIFYQKRYIKYSASYCIFLYETEEYFKMLWKDWTQGLCLNHPWP